jgi:hypothetical protein
MCLTADIPIVREIPSETGEAEEQPAVHGAVKQARASATIILRKWDDLSFLDRRKIVTAFRLAMIPKRRAGRKLSEAITAAYTDWKFNIRGVALFRKHILNWERLSRWRRRAEERSLMDAIYSRNRRERKQANNLTMISPPLPTNKGPDV